MKIIPHGELRAAVAAIVVLHLLLSASPCAGQTAKAGDEDRAWLTALEADRTGDEASALAAYQSFLDAYQNSSRLPVAMERIHALRGKMEAEQSARLAEIQKETDEAVRIDKCNEFLARYPTGPLSGKVKEILDASVWAMQRRADEAQGLAQFKAAQNDDQVLALGQHFLANFPQNPDRSYVEWKMGAAKVNVDSRLQRERRDEEKRLKKERRKIGKPQRVAGVVVMTGGVLIAVAGGVFAGIASSQYDGLKKKCEDEFDSSYCPTDYKNGTEQDIKNNALIADIAFGVGAAVAIAGVITLVLAPSWKKQQKENKDAISAAVLPTGDGRGAVLGISWSL